MNRLRTRLIAVFLLATLLPLGLTLWTSLSLLERSLQLAPLAQMDALSQSLEKTGRELYQQARESLRRDAADGRVQPMELSAADAQAFRERGLDEEFVLAGVNGDRLDYYVSGKQKVLLYSRQLNVPLGELTKQIGGARQTVETSGVSDFRRGLRGALLLIAASLSHFVSWTRRAKSLRASSSSSPSQGSDSHWRDSTGAAKVSRKPRHD